MQPTKADNVELLTVTCLRQRGWSAGLIRKFLGKADATKANPVYRTQARMKLYERARVQAVEASCAWQAAKLIADLRSVVAKGAAKRRAKALLALATSMPIRVHALASDRLLDVAIQHYNHYHAEGACERGEISDKQASRSDSADFLRRIQVNYIRHRLTKYDFALESLAGQVGVHQAGKVIRQRVYQAIGEAYPWLRAECARQLAVREQDSCPVQASLPNRPAAPTAQNAATRETMPAS